MVGRHILKNNNNNFEYGYKYQHLTFRTKKLDSIYIEYSKVGIQCDDLKYNNII